MSSDTKMKGLLKGLRFISQIFDNNEKETEIEIGLPTDVKHVAHIGWDGPTENSPSWMNEFKSVPGLSSSAPLNTNRNIHSKGPDDSAKWVSSDSMGRGSRSLNIEEDTHELPLPKSSKHHSHSSGNMRESHAKEKSDKPRQPKRHTKHSTPNNDSFNESKLTTEQIRPMDTDSLQLQGTTNDNLPPRIQPEIPKRTYSKKTRDVQGVGGSSKSRSKAQHKEPNSGEGAHSRSSLKSKEHNLNEGSHSRLGSKSSDSNSNEVSFSRTTSKSKDLNSKEGPHLRSGSKSKDSNFNEGDPSKSNLKSRNKHRLSEEDGQLKRGSNEDLLRNYPN